MKPLVKVIPIGTWDFGRMRSHAYMKEGGFTRRGHLFGLGAEEEEAKFIVICCSFIFVVVVCVIVLDRL